MNTTTPPAHPQREAILEETIEALLDLESAAAWIVGSQQCDDCELIDIELVADGIRTIAIAADGSILPSGVRADSASLFHGYGITFAEVTGGEESLWLLAQKGVVV